MITLTVNEKFQIRFTGGALEDCGFTVSPINYHDEVVALLEGECDDCGVLMTPPTRVTPFGVYLVLTGKGYFCEGIDESEIEPRPDDQL